MNWSTDELINWRPKAWSARGAVAAAMLGLRLSRFFWHEPTSLWLMNLCILGKHVSSSWTLFIVHLSFIIHEVKDRCFLTPILRMFFFLSLLTSAANKVRCLGTRCRRERVLYSSLACCCKGNFMLDDGPKCKLKPTKSDLGTPGSRKRQRWQRRQRRKGASPGKFGKFWGGSTAESRKGVNSVFLEIGRSSSRTILLLSDLFKHKGMRLQAWGFVWKFIGLEVKFFFGVGTCSKNLCEDDEVDRNEFYEWMEDIMPARIMYQPCASSG